MAAGLNVFKKRKSEKLNFTSFLVLSPPINSVFHIRVTFVTQASRMDFWKLIFCTCLYLSEGMTQEKRYFGKDYLPANVDYHISVQ